MQVGVWAKQLLADKVNTPEDMSAKPHTISVMHNTGYEEGMYYMRQNHSKPENRIILEDHALQYLHILTVSQILVFLRSTSDLCSASITAGLYTISYHAGLHYKAPNCTNGRPIMTQSLLCAIWCYIGLHYKTPHWTIQAHYDTKFTLCNIMLY